ncbi:cobalt-precorrin-5B (C(1))-methyltransferase, partial [Kitasatospora sp. NPDC007106]|uniref:cobalt-precorrin-5B (C(1))-methyltransferase n=1 Tax=Kitasatospora sp. NPDC007106 TaxID=3156914 RepID=UPI0033F71D41
MAEAGGRAAQLKSSGLRHGWTTGACATAATAAAYTALLTGEFPDPVEIVLPKGQPEKDSAIRVCAWAAVYVALMVSFLVRKASTL